MPPVVRLALWFRLLSTPARCHCCRRGMWFNELHFHIGQYHLGCMMCRLAYIDAWDDAFANLFPT